MLDSVTKRRIDTARDILVGKIPDPKSQVEQITIALIYKFMDDMDKEAEELGGKRHFFTGDLETYSWTKLMSAETGGHQLLKLYGEAIEKFQTSQNLPQLFRDIFKNAFLPYRDPETLRLFLKTINDFTYEHSERLGDAFEYLLSVMDSQGDAGQFRTPRHIIDFIVAAVEPQKDDRILDPACGTAGFLISAYKYIMKHNIKEGKEGGALLPDEKSKLLNNIVGYDISPDMVRLSRVNMYLHGFPTPQIAEYDTLTSDDRWAEYYDVIMANPPFMTPKGGIIPHQHFSVQAKRSEVLFVDYIAEHLLQNGRAGVIVPDGIIFRSSDAYKALRKMLVDNYLYAVVFLPAGVFNPYAGVKTSILLMDKRLARMTDSILFVKVENDGFDLGAQRKQVTGSDLPEATKAIEEFKKAVLAGQAVCSSALALVVQKSEIAANGDYNLSAERYREADTQCHKWPMVELGNLEIFDIKSGGTPDSENDSYWNGSISWATLVDLPQENHISAITSTKRTISEFGLKNSSANLLPIHSILVSSRATIGRVAINEIELATNQGFKNIVIKDKHKANYRYVAYVVKTLENKMNELASGGTFKEISKTSFSLLKIPLPPLPTQQEIVAEIEGYQKIIDGARQVVENYKPQIKIDPAWPMVELGEISTVTSSKRIFESEYVSEGIPFYRTKEVVELSQNKPISLELFISNDRYESIKRDFGVPQKGDLLISAVGTIGISWLIPDARQFYFKDGNLLWIKDISSIRPNYLKHMLDVILLNDLDKYINGAAYKALTIVVLKRLKIPLPKLVQQDQIVAQIEKEQALVNASKQLIAIYEQKIKDKIAEVWGGAV